MDDVKRRESSGGGGRSKLTTTFASIPVIAMRAVFFADCRYGL